MFKYTKHFLGKIESLFSELDYDILYERGNFQSGYCIVENRDIIVINKYYNTEARINTLLEILEMIGVDVSKLSTSNKKLFLDLKKSVFAPTAELK